MPRNMLCSEDVGRIVTYALKGKQGWEKLSVRVSVGELPEGCDIDFWYQKIINAVIIPDSLLVKDEGEGLPSYPATIRAIAEKIRQDDFSVSCSLLGKGSSERHYVALYREHGQLSIFDSKISIPDRFLNSSTMPTILEKFWGYLTAPFSAFGLWAFGIGKQVQASFLGENVTIHRLGTQPLLDGVSCGFHAAGAVLRMADLMTDSSCSTDLITSAIINCKNLDEMAETIFNASTVPRFSVSPALSRTGLPVINASSVEAETGGKVCPSLHSQPVGNSSKDFPEARSMAGASTG